MSLPLLSVTSGPLRREGANLIYCGIILDAAGIVWRCEHEHWQSDAATRCAQNQYALWRADPPRRRPVAAGRARQEPTDD